MFKRLPLNEVKNVFGEQAYDAVMLYHNSETAWQFYVLVKNSDCKDFKYDVSFIHGDCLSYFFFTNNLRVAKQKMRNFAKRWEISNSSVLFGRRYWI